MKILSALSISLVLAVSLSSFWANSSAADLTIAGFDPTGSSRITTISNNLAQNAAVQNADSLLHGNDPIGGNAHGSVTLVEFFDYRCPHCIHMNSTIEALIHSNPNLRVVYKIFPILGPASELAARAALAANKQGKFNAFHQALMLANGNISINNIFDIANSAGLDTEKLKTDMNSESVSNIINNNLNLATRMGINGTPAIFITKTNLSSNSSPADILFIFGESSFANLQQSFNRMN